MHAPFGNETMSHRKSTFSDGCSGMGLCNQIGCLRAVDQTEHYIYICSIWALVKGRDPPTVPELYPTCTADQMESPTLCSQRLIFGDFQHDQSVNRNSHATLIILSEIHQTCQCSGLSSSSKYEELPCFGFSKNRISDSIH